MSKQGHGKRGAVGRGGVQRQAVTAELEAWIVAQAEAGCQPQAVLDALLASGWQRDVAVQAMEDALSQHLKDRGLPAASGSGSDATLATPDSAAAAGTAASTASAGTAGLAVPEPDLGGDPVQIDAGDRLVQVVFTSQSPRVVLLGGFLSEEECDALVAMSRSRLARSETVVNLTGGSEVNAARTSDGMFFERGENDLCQRIEARIARVLRWPVSHGEGLQVLRYRPGAEYKAHYDYFDPAQPGARTILARGGQRVGTLVMYLNTPDQGGATTFPEAGLTVAPVKGHAVFFSYAAADPSSRSLHAGAPVHAGEKWVATKWLRQRVFN